MWHQLFSYVQENYISILFQIGSHLRISFFAIFVASAIGVPLGYVASKTEKLEKVVVAPFHILRVVPSLAILVILIPIVGTGAVPAIIALTVLALPPVIINTIVGFREVPQFMLECGKGIGMDDRTLFWKVRLPLAMSMIFAGIRTGLVEAVASATLAAKIGAGGLGEIIFTGLGLFRMDLLLLGGVLVAVLSFLCGFTFDRIGKRFRYIE